MKRREFLVGCSAALALASLGQASSFAFSPKAEKEIFVLIFLRGGCDALNLVAPMSDRFYVDARSADLRITDNGKTKGWLLNNTLNNLDFALHQAAQPLLELYQNKQLAIIHACGLTNGTRSHFDAMELIEKGIIEKKGTMQGWLSRYLAHNAVEAYIPALAIDSLPLSLLGNNQSIAVNDLKNYDLKGDPRLKGILKSLYKDDEIAQRTFESIEVVQKNLERNSKNQVQPYQPLASAKYPTDWFAKGFTDSLQTIAQTIKMDVGLHVATASLGGWDTHENQAWVFNNLVKTLSEGLMAFYNDTQAYQKKMTVLVMSEFGRRLRSNKSNGTDHGYGGVMLALGGNVNGGRMYGKWNGLATEQLDNGVDLAVTTDYRTVLSEVLSKRLQAKQLNTIFPNFDTKTSLGFIK